MVTVAVAGGTGGVGRTIVEALTAGGKHEVKIFGRKANPALEAQLGVPIIPVDYNDVAALTAALEAHNIHTLISALTMIPMDGPPREIELIRAADASRTTKRLVSSNWGIHHEPAHIGFLPSVQHKLDAHAALEQTTTLEWATFANGYFLDYWGLPILKTNMTPMTQFIDIPNRAAAIPGAGNTPVVFTHTTDVAKFVAASLDLPEGSWQRDFTIVGDRVTWNEFLALVEKSTGEKFTVVHDSIENLKAGKATELEGYKGAYDYIPKEMLLGLLALFGKWFDEGVFDLKPKVPINELFPEIKTKKVAEFLEEAWRKA